MRSINIFSMRWILNGYWFSQLIGVKYFLVISNSSWREGISTLVTSQRALKVFSISVTSLDSFCILKSRNPSPSVFLFQGHTWRMEQYRIGVLCCHTLMNGYWNLNMPISFRFSIKKLQHLVKNFVNKAMEKKLQNEPESNNRVARWNGILAVIFFILICFILLIRLSNYDL